MLDNIDHSTPSRHIFVIIVLHLSKILHIDFQFLIFVREKKSILTVASITFPKVQNMKIEQSACKHKAYAGGKVGTYRN